MTKQQAAANSMDITVTSVTAAQLFAGNVTLHTFGTLVSLSPSKNSPYSNQTVGKKQEAFKAKLVYDSLKLKHIFEVKQNDEWNEDKSKQHQKEMSNLMIRYYKSTLDGAFNG